MNNYLRDLKGDKKKMVAFHIQNIIDRKKQQVVEAKKLVKTYKLQLGVARKVKNNDYPLKKIWMLKDYDIDEKTL